MHHAKASTPVDTDGNDADKPVVDKRLSPKAILVAVSVFVISAALIGVARLGESAAATQVGVFFQNTTPKLVTDQDRLSVTLGVKFSSKVDGTISGVRFFKGPKNSGKHTATLWSSGGKALATTTFTGESSSGWQTARFSKPVPIKKGASYIASYLAPNGGYSADVGGFDKSLNKGALTIPKGGGVYIYGDGGFPRQNYQNSNYYVDVVFTPGDTVTPSATPTASASASASPSPKPSATKTPTPTASPSQPPSGGSSALSLPRIPWEGGSDYWKKFSKPTAAGWTDPSFFPIVATFNGISSNKEVAYDKSLGFNSYLGLWEGTQYKLFKDNGVFWIGDKLNSSFTDASTNWVGDDLGDEVDGRYSVADGQDFLQSQVDKFGDDGRFKYTNFTQIVMSNDIKTRDAEKYVNAYADAVSLDMYWYTIPFCDLKPYRDVYLTPIKQSNCRTASSYGRIVDSLRVRDAADGKLQPLWQVVELVNGGPGGGPFLGNVTGGQVKGAVMNSIIHEARGILYFNQSMSGSCASGNLIRDTQTNSGFCAASQVAAAKKVNLQIKALAPVLNSQSYKYKFGRGLDTMLKAKDGYAYVFAMVDGASSPGERTLKLPPGVSGTSVEVMFEDRAIQAGSDGKFTDQFPAEYSYHIYKVALG
jgi:hypothetical protein